MFDEVLAYFRKATDSTIQIQKEVLRYWFQQLSQVPGVPTPGSLKGWNDQAHAIEKKWSQTVTDMLTKHREALDVQYGAGIQIIEDAFRVAEAKDPKQLRKLIEELWLHSFDCLKTVVKAQMGDLQAQMDDLRAAAEKDIEAVSKGETAAKL